MITQVIAMLTIAALPGGPGSPVMSPAPFDLITAHVISEAAEISRLSNTAADCLTAVRWESASYGGQTVHLRNSCSQRVWYKGCYVHSASAQRKSRYGRDSGFIEPNSTKGVYLLSTDENSRGTLEWNEGAKPADVAYPSQCAPTP